MKKYIKEFLFFPDITVMVILFIGMLSYTFPYLLKGSTWVAVAIGMVAYATSEYMIHRFLFHMKKPKHPFLLKLIKRLHYDHHVDPNNLKLLFLPLWFSLPNFTITTFIFYVITSNLQLSIAYLTGLTSYFLFYEWKHYIAHKPIQPITNLGRKIKRAHLWHHFKNENYWYGVSHRVYDKAFGTYKDQRQVERSETARNLEKRA